VVPVPTGSRRPKIIAAAAAVLVVGVAAPVIAVTASGGSDTPEPVSNETTQPTEPDKAAIAKAVQLDRDLARILKRLDDELARPDQDKAEIKRLKTLRAAVIAQQKQLASPK
jgi:peptidoglycan hydrolase CwlO-like protein